MLLRQVKAGLARATPYKNGVGVNYMTTTGDILLDRLSDLEVMKRRTFVMKL